MATSKVVKALVFGLMLTAAGIVTPASAQNERGTIEVLRDGNIRSLFVFKPTSNIITCSDIDTGSITPKKAIALQQLIFAEALIHKDDVGYLYMVSNPNGPIQVYLSTYVLRQCALDESQHHKMSFQGEGAFAKARAYYHELLVRFSQ